MPILTEDDVLRKIPSVRRGGNAEKRDDQGKRRDRETPTHALDDSTKGHHLGVRRGRGGGELLERQRVMSGMTLRIEHESASVSFGALACTA